MSVFAKTVKRNLVCQLENLNKIRSLFVSDPEKDFSRKRKLGFQETMRILLSMGGQESEIRTPRVFFL